MPLPRRRLALIAILLPLLALVSLAGSAGPFSRAQAQSYDGIAGVALKYVGTHGGQCWTFVQKVVKEATGRQMGFDYRQGYFDAGAIEVSMDEARAGDIIQIIDDAYTAPDADYPGMHTAIVVENHGDGSFKVVDSNRNWDEMVTVHDNYRPLEVAKRVGLDVHFYRIEGGGQGDVPKPQVPVEPTDPTELGPGDVAYVVTPGEYLNLRFAPQIADNIIGKLNHGTRITVLAGPVPGGSLLWVMVSTPSGDGWVAAQYLAKEDEPGAPASGGGNPRQPDLRFRTRLPGLAADRLVGSNVFD